MSELKLQDMRTLITQCKQRELQSHDLLNYIAVRLPRMHPNIALPKDDTEQALLNFAIRYVEHAPDFIEAIESCTREANIYPQTAELLTITSDFFTKPPELVAHRHGLQALIDQAYLAHRLMEEINDRLIVATGSPLTPMDMTMSNLVIHDLIGDKFANKLDMIVLYTIERSFQSEQLVQLTQHQNNAEYCQQEWEDALKKWPCLAGDNVISMKLDSNSDDDDPDPSVH